MISNEIKDLFRRYIHYSPEVLKDVSDTGSISQNTLGIIAGANDVNSIDPYKKRRSMQLMRKGMQVGMIPAPTSVNNPLTDMIIGRDSEEGFSQVTRNLLTPALNYVAKEAADEYLPSLSRTVEHTNRRAPQIGEEDPVMPNRRLLSTGLSVNDPPSPTPSAAPQPPMQPGRTTNVFNSPVHGPKLQHN